MKHGSTYNMTNKKSVGYTGSTPISAGAFYAPYIPLQISQSQYEERTWQDNLRRWTEIYSHTLLSTADVIDMVWKQMQDQHPGAYSVVIDSELPDEPRFKTRYGPASIKPLQLCLNFANAADETWFRLQHG